ncbi:HNH endonuclease [Plantibacter sp. YIM 135249]|uniref:HNH endonuclease n=1 Tax=Plantibacter sp. YIM 135249 TaxID=3423918 RepID=UPI003D3351EE
MIAPKVALLSKAEQARLSKAAYDAVATRSGGVCEGCGRRRATEMHHRRYRSQGGRDEVTNLLHLCGRGNASGCHGIAHTGPGREAGFSVHSLATPAEVPVNYRLAGLALLTDDVTDEHRGVKRIIHTRKEH